MGKVVIGIHGLENKPSKEILESWWLLSMKEGLKGIGKKQRIPRFELVYWADYFYSSPLDERIGDKDDPLFLDEPYRIAPVSLRPETSNIRIKILDFLGEKVNKFLLSPDFSLKYSSLLDSITEKYFHELSEYFNGEQAGSEKNVRERIVSRLAEVLRRYDGHEIFLVAHSMGSVIAFDTLSLQEFDVRVKVLATIGSPLGMPNVISKLAGIQRTSGVENVSMKTPPSVEKCWYNFSDPDDKVAFNYKLSDDYRENKSGVKPTDFVVFNNYIINSERNPHKSYGYLRTKEFATVLAEFLESKQTFRQWIKNTFYRVTKFFRK
ncbi:MAG TPA: hypothetical protein PLE67_10790 [Tenuifilaceae bacterium]|nr:hypothetical protein [Tenuifilaceae bacterium]HPQ35659.1 hypothetical protein [Tenuifilaceae bacterium]